MTDAWNPEQYERYKDERSRPFWDLVSLVEPREGLRVVDLGCGTGELTAALHQHVGAATTLGIDSSDAMLARCREHARGTLSFAKGDIATLPAEPGREGAFDLVIANASLQWVPDHAALLPKLRKLLARGGQIAIQVPYNGHHAAYATADEVAAEEPFRAALDGSPHRLHALAPHEYSRLLHAAGFAHQDVRLQVYPHLLDSRDGVVEWVKGTFLTGYSSRLPPALYQQFLARYRQRLLPRLDDTRPHLFPFCRIHVTGRLAG